METKTEACSSSKVQKCHQHWRFDFVAACEPRTWQHQIWSSNEPYTCRSQWPCGLRRRSSAARLLRSWVRIPPGTWMFVCCECCVLSGRSLCDGLITRPEESYRLWRVVVCEQETSKHEEDKARYRAVQNTTRWVVTPGKQTNKH